MAITFKIKAKKITATTREGIIDQITNRAGSFYRFEDTLQRTRGNILVGQHRGNMAGLVRLYSLEKHNPKSKTTKRLITRGKRKGEIEVTKEVIKRSHWVAYYYDVRAELVDMEKTKQHHRHFTLVLK